ncbi:MAG: SAM-dependent methyltransferase [Chloroflexi bacterium]|nr:SAM-dependent methyltransferase [Chloroflexota bacterium]
MTASADTNIEADDFALADEFALATRTPLLPLLVGRIEAAGGRITFAEFMAQALGHPEHGYYSRAGLTWGRDGDYETSPEVHPIFGYLWARQALECWQRLGEPSSFALVEVGCGSGVFMRAMLTWLRVRAPRCFAAVRPVMLDGHPNRLVDQRTHLAGAGFEAEHVLTADWLARPDRITGVVISNEFFDALPVHLIRRDGETLVEQYVAHDGDAVHFVDGPLSTPAIEAYFARLGLQPGDGALAEVGLAASEAMHALASKVESGYVLSIDYGYPARDLYASWRRQGTLMAFRRHSPQPDPLAEPGRLDLTVHVDFTSLAAAAEGFAAAPLVSQAEALMALGLGDALRTASQHAAADAQRFAADRRAAEVLCEPEGLGRIRVLALAKGASLDGLRCLRSVIG